METTSSEMLSKIKDTELDKIGFRLVKEWEDMDFDKPLRMEIYQYKDIVVEKSFVLLDTDKWGDEQIAITIEKIGEPLTVKELEAFNKITNIIFKQ